MSAGFCKVSSKDSYASLKVENRFSTLELSPKTFSVAISWLSLKMVLFLKKLKEKKEKNFLPIFPIYFPKIKSYVRKSSLIEEMQKSDHIFSRYTILRVIKIYFQICWTKVLYKSVDTNGTTQIKNNQFKILFLGQNF